MASAEVDSLAKIMALAGPESAARVAKWAGEKTRHIVKLSVQTAVRAKLAAEVLSELEAGRLPQVLAE